MKIHFTIIIIVICSEVDKRKIDLPDGIKTCGTRDVNVSLYHGVTGTFKVQVTEE